LGLPFVAIGLYFIFGRFIYKAYRKRRTVYAVTDRRVMEIFRGRQGDSVDAVYLRSIPNISTSAGSNGRGCVEFGISSRGYSSYAGMRYLSAGVKRFVGSGVPTHSMCSPDARWRSTVSSSLEEAVIN
jgi:hypothetical protein